MRLLILFLFISFGAGAHPLDTGMIRAGLARQATIEQLKSELKASDTPEDKLRILDSLSMYYLYFSRQTDSALICANQSIDLAFPLADKRPLILAYARRSNYFWQKTNLKEALENTYHGIKLSRDHGIPDFLSTHYQNIVSIYMQLSNPQQICENARLQFENLRYHRDPFFDQEVLALGSLGFCKLFENEMDSAFHFLKAAFDKSQNSDDPIARNIAIWYSGNWYHQSQKYREADSVYQIGRRSCLASFDNQNLDAIYWELGNNYRSMNDLDQAIRYARLGLDNSRSIQDHFATLIHYQLLGECYETIGEKDSVLRYLKLSSQANGDLFNSNRVYGMNEVAFSEQVRERELLAAQQLEQEKQKNRLKLYGFSLVSLLLAIAGIFQWRFTRQKQKSMEVLRIEKEKTEEEKQKAISALEHLKAAQNQLVQREKMASLGELTAGIAHEIQNPLNFVNNFSELNGELLNEIQEERRKGKRDEAVETELFQAVKENQGKILLHGQKADAIVKSMLLHSRTGSGQKEPTDVNKLAEEYLKLAYLNFKAKYRNFNSEFSLDLASDIPMISAVPQDIGRALLNLINNAFYAVNQRAEKGEPDYQPAVAVASRNVNGWVEISVKDNGFGIPKEIREKIFQPFFTTKPTGEGTGLGLSLAYDIVTKGHGGTLEMISKDGEGSEFLIRLPASQTLA